jgi:phospholipid N-methyltransferase
MCQLQSRINLHFFNKITKNNQSQNLINNDKINQENHIKLNKIKITSGVIFVPLA